MEYSVHSGFETLALSPRNTEKLKLVVDERINASLLVTYSGTWESLQVEVIASPYSSLTLMLKNDGSEDVVLQVSGSVHRDASLTLALCELNAGNTQARVTLDLCEEGAFAMLRSACIAASRKQFHMQCNHLQAHTEGLMENMPSWKKADSIAWRPPEKSSRVPGKAIPIRRQEC